jgi:hypothetical protein
MGDPVTMAVVGASAGAMMNKKDPLKGALLGAAGGYGGASMMGLGAAPNIASTAGTTGLGMAGNAAATTTPGVAAFNQTFTPIAAEVAPAAADVTSLINQGLSADLALDAANAAGTAGGYTGYGMAGNPAANMSLLDKFGAGAKELGQYAQQNPVLTAMAVQTGQQMLQQPQRQASPPGLLRGNQIQASAPQYQLGSPKVSLI